MLYGMAIIVADLVSVPLTDFQIAPFAPFVHRWLLLFRPLIPGSFLALNNIYVSSINILRHKWVKILHICNFCNDASSLRGTRNRLDTSLPNLDIGDERLCSGVLFLTGSTK